MHGLCTVSPSNLLFYRLSQNSSYFPQIQRFKYHRMSAKICQIELLIMGSLVQTHPEAQKKEIL